MNIIIIVVVSGHQTVSSLTNPDAGITVTCHYIAHHSSYFLSRVFHAWFLKNTFKTRKTPVLARMARFVVMNVTTKLANNTFIIFIFYFYIVLHFPSCV